MWQIFGAKECAVDLTDKPRIVIDAGANVGYASVFYANSYPGAKIIAVEPDAGNVAIARTNLTPYPNVTLVNGGIWSHDTSLVIENPKDQPWAFRMEETDESDAGAIPGYTVSRLLSDHGVDHVDLLKMDIEGGEEDVFARGPLDWLDACKVVVIEVHGQQASEIVEAKMRKQSYILKRQGEKLVYSRPSAKVRQSWSAPR